MDVREQNDFERYISGCVLTIVDAKRNPKGTVFWVSGPYCVTCFHVVSGRVPGSISIDYRGRLLAARYRQDLSSEEDDLAVLEVVTPVSEVSYAPLGRG